MLITLKLNFVGVITGNTYFGNNTDIYCSISDLQIKLFQELLVRIRDIFYGNNLEYRNSHCPGAFESSLCSKSRVPSTCLVLNS